MCSASELVLFVCFLFKVLFFLNLNLKTDAAIVTVYSYNLHRASILQKYAVTSHVLHHSSIGI